MDAGPIFAIGFVFLIVAIIVTTHVRLSAKLKALPTFDDYRAAHPGLVGNGRVACASCGGSQIHVRGAASLATGAVNLHDCRVCGRTLYRSKR